MNFQGELCFPYIRCHMLGSYPFKSRDKRLNSFLITTPIVKYVIYEQKTTLLKLIIFLNNKNYSILSIISSKLI